MIAASPAAPAESRESSKARPRRPWSPTKDEDFIYELVKFGGKTQQEVASMQRISQSTVSRIVKRYERWLAHAEDRAAGRLDPAERRRAQYWLTYERNERMIASALRLAQTMEGFVDHTKTVITRPHADYSQEGQTQTSHGLLDRTGQACRFLRLAFRINMEQMELTDREPPPRPEPLAYEEQVHLEDEAALDAVEIQARNDKIADQQREWEAEQAEPPREGGCGSRSEPRQEQTPTPEAVVGCANHSHPTQAQVSGPADPEAVAELEREDAVAFGCGFNEPTQDAPDGNEIMQPVHILHDENSGETDANTVAACSCDAGRRKRKKWDAGCMASAAVRSFTTLATR